MPFKKKKRSSFGLFSNNKSSSSNTSSMESQKLRYGASLYEKNPKTGKYRCFFCNKELRANFSRHISRHEANGDKVNEDFKKLILNELNIPITPIPKSQTFDSISVVKKTSTTPSLSFSSMKYSSSNTQNRVHLEQQYFHLIFYIIRKLPSYLLNECITQKFIALSEEQIVSSSNINNIGSFYNTIKQIGIQLLSTRGNLSFEKDIIDKILDLLYSAYKEELCKSLETKNLQKCSICYDDKHVPLIRCNGDCLRGFHVTCAINSDLIQVIQISTLSSGYACICNTCNNDNKILHWDSQEKQYFYNIFINNDNNTQQPEKIKHITNKNIENEIQINKTDGKELELNEKQRNIINNDITIPIKTPIDIKISLQKEEKKNKKEMYYDPFWCVWRYKRKDNIEKRNMYQKDKISRYKIFSDDSIDSEEPPTKKQKQQ